LIEGEDLGRSLTLDLGELELVDVDEECLLAQC
jgi:hypothetical protein